MTTPTATSSETTAKKDVSKLQRAIVDGLEDVKAQDIQVFNTEHLTALFERVIVASGTSNRQTKALAASVRDAVRDAGFAKPRMEGEENGEWIIVDCGAAVVHIMQPTIRQYYRLEELWGEKPVRLKLGAPKPAAPAAAKVPAKTAARRAAKAEAEAIESGQTTAPKAPAKAAVKAVGRKPTVRNPTRPAAEEPIETPKPAARKTAAKTATKTVAKTAVKTATKTATKTAVKTPIKTLVVKPRAEKSPAKKAAPRTGIKPVRKTTASIDAADAVKTTKAPARKPAARKA